MQSGVQRGLQRARDYLHVISVGKQVELEVQRGREMTACRLALKLQGGASAWGGEAGPAGLQSRVIFMGHITGTAGEKPDEEDLKRRAPNVFFRGSISSSQ